MDENSNRLKSLIKNIGKKKFSFELEDRICYSYDASFYRNIPKAIIFPESEEDLIEIAKFSYEYNIPLTARGMGSGFTGGAVPVDGGIVISYEKLNKIILIDKKRFLAIVEPGIITGDLQQHLEKYSLQYPPDPSSSDYSSIGGNIAECAGGLRGVKYGVTKNYCLGIEFITGKGEKIKTGIFNPEIEALSNLKSILVGSEGTLVLFSKIALKLLKKPHSAATLLLYFKKVENAAEFAEIIIENGILPSVMEIVDELSIEKIREFSGYSFPDETKSFLLIELEDNKEVNRTNTELIQELSAKKGCLKFEIAENETDRANIWKIRKSISPSLRRIAPDKINEDISLPRSKVSEMFKTISEISKEFNIPIPTFGHIGDGNVHVNIMIDKKDDKQLKDSEKALEKLFEGAIKLGGTLSGEHGIGLSKKAFLNRKLSENEINLSKRVKTVFDEKNTLNPGKIFEN